MSTHLKPEEFSDLLLGTAGEEATTHLSACSQCRTEMEAMRETLGAFRSATVKWSEGAARQVSVPKTKREMSIWFRPAWVLAAALTFAIMLSISVWHGHGNKPPATGDAQAQISRDNQLLAHIESEVGEITPAPMEPLQVNSQVRTR